VQLADAQSGPQVKSLLSCLPSFYPTKTQTSVAGEQQSYATLKITMILSAVKNSKCIL
jgi:hypothetical protein